MTVSHSSIIRNGRGHACLLGQALSVKLLVVGHCYFRLLCQHCWHCHIAGQVHRPVGVTGNFGCGVVAFWVDGFVVNARC